MKTKAAYFLFSLLFALGSLLSPLHAASGPVVSGGSVLQEVVVNPGPRRVTASSASVARTSGNSFVTVGDPGNAADTTTGYGAVDYTFQIQKFEFTNVEYVEFLNAVGGTNPNGIYSSSMSSDVRGGITQSGASPNFTYAVKANMGDKPVNYVRWFEAARVANWLHNGRSTNPALLETGAYTLNNATTGVGFTKNVGATYWIPSENEWYKAAYYKGGGVSAGYWIYPTKSDTEPTYVTASSTGVGSTGVGSTANSINGNFAADWNGQDGNVTTVGSNGGPSAYGTYDMGGNVWEWDDAAVSGSSRVDRGGSWHYFANYARSDYRGNYNPSNRNYNLGFRLARSSVP
jgi:sulfatase modifying factor 1